MKSSPVSISRGKPAARVRRNRTGRRNVVLTDAHHMTGTFKRGHFMSIGLILLIIVILILSIYILAAATATAAAATLLVPVSSEQSVQGVGRVPELGRTVRIIMMPIVIVVKVKRAVNERLSRVENFRLQRNVLRFQL